MRTCKTCGAAFKPRGRQIFCNAHKYVAPTATYGGPEQVGTATLGALRRGHMLKRTNGDYLIVRKVYRSSRGAVVVGLRNERLAIPAGASVELWS